MNKIFSLILALFLATSFGYAQDRIIHQSELPNEIQHYLSIHFPNSKVLKVEEDKGYFSTSYEVKLQNNIELEFKGTKIKDIDADRGTKLPDSVIPERIRRYVFENYPNSFVTDWELDDDDNRQQVGLNNGLELEFDKQGRFIKLDD